MEWVKHCRHADWNIRTVHLCISQFTLTCIKMEISLLGYLLCCSERFFLFLSALYFSPFLCSFKHSFHLFLPPPPVPPPHLLWRPSVYFSSFLFAHRETNLISFSGLITHTHTLSQALSRTHTHTHTSTHIHTHTHTHTQRSGTPAWICIVSNTRCRFKERKPSSAQSWALAVFFHFFTNKKLFFCTFFQVNNLFLHQSYLKSPLPVKLTW